VRLPARSCWSENPGMAMAWDWECKACWEHSGVPVNSEASSGEVHVAVSPAMQSETRRHAAAAPSVLA